MPQETGMTASHQIITALPFVKNSEQAIQNMKNILLSELPATWSYS
jgi:hypothetical protein